MPTTDLVCRACRQIADVIAVKDSRDPDEVYAEWLTSVHHERRPDADD